MSLIVAGGNIFLSLVLIFILGAAGAIVSIMLAEFIVLCFYSILLYKYLNKITLFAYFGGFIEYTLMTVTCWVSRK